MSNVLTTAPVPTRLRALHTVHPPVAHPPCPSWCVRHLDDFDSVNPGATAWTRSHRGPGTSFSYPVEGTTVVIRVLIQLGRLDAGGEVGATDVTIDSVNDAFPDENDGIHRDHPMGLDATGRFAEVLRDTLALAGAR